MKRFLWFFVLLVIPVTALQAMTVAVFLEKADALERRGAMAMFSSDLRLLKSEVKGAGEALKAERERRRASGQRPLYCAPERVQLNSRDLLAHFRSIPPAQRQRTEVRDALRQLMVRRYPCPA